MLTSAKRFRTRVTSVAMRTYLRSERNRRNNFVVCGYPKSGTTWVTQLIGAVSGLTYQQNNVRFRLSNVALHTHGTAFQGATNLLYVVRDPRETVCSAARAMKALNRDDVFGGDGMILDDFVTYAMTNLPGARQSMHDHLQACIDQEWHFTRFEDLKSSPEDCVAGLVEHYGFNFQAENIEDVVAQFDFGKLKKAKAGDVFLAQSSLASWTRLLSPLALERINEHCGAQAKFFGYELNTTS